MSITTEYTYFNPHARAYKNIDRENTFFFDISALCCVLYNAAPIHLKVTRIEPTRFSLARTASLSSLALAT
ncbi:MAG: hypothetical protein RSB97_04565, partial [Christensenella sp.]